MRYATLGKAPSIKAPLLLISTVITTSFLISGCQVKPAGQRTTLSYQAITQPVVSAVNISLNGAYSGLVNTAETPEQCPDFLVSNSDIERFFNRPAKRANTPVIIVSEVVPTHVAGSEDPATESATTGSSIAERSYSINHQASNCYATGTMTLNGTESASWRVDRTGQGYYQYGEAVYTVQCTSCIEQIDKESNKAWVAQQKVEALEAALEKRQFEQAERLKAFAAKIAPVAETAESDVTSETGSDTASSAPLDEHAVPAESNTTRSETIKHVP